MKRRWGNKGGWFLLGMILVFIAIGLYTQAAKSFGPYNRLVNTDYDRMYTVSEGRLSWCPEGE